MHSFDNWPIGICTGRGVGELEILLGVISGKVPECERTSRGRIELQFQSGAGQGSMVCRSQDPLVLTDHLFPAVNNDTRGLTSDRHTLQISSEPGERAPRKLQSLVERFPPQA